MLSEVDWELLERQIQSLKCPVLLDFHHCIFCIEVGVVSWNTDNNGEDLYRGHGNTYSNELVEGWYLEGEKILCNAEDGCGSTATLVFPASKRLSHNYLEAKYG